MKGSAIASGILAAVLLARSPLVRAQATPAQRPVFKSGSKSSISLTVEMDAPGYARDGSDPPAVSAQMLAADGSVVYDATKNPGGALTKKDARTYRYLLRIPLRSFQTDHYRLLFNAGRNGSKPISREASFSID